ncbi:hypothetical protein PybrP1_000982 [[Pythium] brassicae (nom. inval.)]|nr:hypothetical protein PybrP1_000982 [[Pythium] brassicae (nom. inval.)]
MGASASSDELGPLGTAAVAEITQFDADRLRVLKQLFLAIVTPSSADDDCEGDTGGALSHHRSLSYHAQHARRHEPNLRHTQFLEALESTDFFSSDVAIFERMFTLLDRTGDEVIFAHEFLIGVCALLRGDLAAKLQVAFELLHEESSQPISKDDVVFVLHTMNQTATYFGDPVVMRRTVLSVVDDVFALRDSAGVDLIQGDVQQADPALKSEASSGPALPSPEVAARVVQHPVVEQYLQGQLV